MTSENVTPEAVAFYESAEDVLTALYRRWQDESGYEQIRDYLIPLRPLASEAGVVLRNMTVRPFGVRFSVGDKVFKLWIAGRTYAYSRIA